MSTHTPESAATPTAADPTPERPLLSVAMVTLGCARNDVDSEELAGRLEAGGFRLVDDAEDADTVVVNTCGFVEAAKKDSVDALLEAADLKTEHGGKAQAVVAVGCLAERYGKDLAESLPEADAVLGFDDYPDIADRLRGILAGESHQAHTPSDRRLLLPITPVERSLSTAAVPGHASGPASVRRRLESGPTASLKLASGCDRRCSFCAIPSFRGSFVSRRPTDVLEEARWLAGQGVKELFLVSENSTSYGKDLGDIRLLETLLPELAAVDGIERVRVSYGDEAADETADDGAAGPGDDAELADWLALARETAERAMAADSRSRSALYQAVGKAWDFALAAEAQPDAFAELLEDAGLQAQERAPMTPVVKLVFGASYDKTRLAEYACVLGHAKDAGLERGSLPAYLDRYPGGLKGLVKDARARRKPAGDAAAKVDEQLAALRTAHPALILEHDAGDAEFVVLIARAMPGGHIGIVAKAADDPALVAKLAKKAIAITPAD